MNMRSHGILFVAMSFVFGSVACGGSTSSSDSASTEQGALATSDGSRDVECTSTPVNGSPLVVSLTSSGGTSFHLAIDRRDGDDRTPIVESDSAKFDASTRSFTAKNDSEMSFFFLTLGATHDRADTFDGTMSILPGEEHLHFSGKVTCRYLQP